MTTSKSRFISLVFLVAFLGAISGPAAQSAIGAFSRVILNSTCTVRTGSGSPESSVTGVVCDLYLRSGGADGTSLYTKGTGSGNTGWEALLTDSGTATLTNKSGNISQWTNDSSYITASTNIVKTATVTLTDAQVKALPTTPITIVTAPGSGLRIKIIAATIYTDFVAGAYTNINTVYSDIKLESGGGIWLSSAIFNDDSMTTDATQMTFVFGNAYVQTLDLGIPNATSLDAAGSSGDPEWSGVIQYQAGTDNIVNHVVRLTVDNNGSGNFTGGNSANRLRVTVYYAVDSVL
jgi:hypothetical protein